MITMICALLERNKEAEGATCHHNREVQDGRERRCRTEFYHDGQRRCRDHFMESHRGLEQPLADCDWHSDVCDAVREYDGDAEDAESKRRRRKIKLKKESATHGPMTALRTAFTFSLRIQT